MYKHIKTNDIQEEGKMKIKEFLKKIYFKLPWVIQDYDLRVENRRIKLKSKLSKKYLSIIDNTIVCEQRISNKIFTCWFQGEGNAPKIVKECIKSMREQFPNNELVVITKDNMKDYLEIPDYILDKWDNGIISNTHMSDILRVALLSKYGGLWLDSTVYCTGDLKRYVCDKNNLFVFKNEHKLIKSHNLSSWLIYSKPNHPIIVNTYKILQEYWRTSKKLEDYFLFHLIFTICAEKFKSEWDKIPFYTNIDPHVLQFYYFYSNFSAENFERCKMVSNFHKLTFKFDKSKLKENNFYDYITLNKRNLPND